MSFKGNDFLCVTLTPLKFIGFYGTVNPDPLSHPNICNPVSCEVHRKPGFTEIVNL